MIPYFSINLFIIEGLFKAISVLLLSTIIVETLNHIIEFNGIVSLSITILSSVMSICFFTYLIALNSNERKVVLTKINKLWKVMQK